MTLDHPRLRRHRSCPLCGSIKDRDTLCCWPCYREHRLRSGNLTVERVFDEAETRLANNQMILSPGRISKGV